MLTSGEPLWLEIKLASKLSEKDDITKGCNIASQIYVLFFRKPFFFLLSFHLGIFFNVFFLVFSKPILKSKLKLLIDKLK